MTGQQAIFFLVAAATLFSAIKVVTTRDLVHAALWLVATLFSVAALYAILNAGFLAVVQVVIYIGAIAILFIFAVMLTRSDQRDRGPQFNRAWWVGALIALLAFGALFAVLLRSGQFARTLKALPADFDAVARLGDALISPDAYVLPFEVASVLLLAALIGAVYVAFSRK